MTVFAAFVGIGVLAVVVVEVRSWRRKGPHIGLNAPMDDHGVNAAHYTHHANSTGSQNGFGGSA